MNVVGLVASPIFQEHETGDHPENSKRLAAIQSLLQEKGYGRKTEMLKPRATTLDELCRVHSPDYIQRIESSACRGGDWLDSDTYVSGGSYRAAVYAAGAVITAVEAVCAGNNQSSFALVRPPGHHALPNRGMGFCLFNNVAVGASHLVERFGLSKIAIIDFDVHHGNGTQFIFESESRVMYCSIHQSPLYPGTGDLDDIGTGKAKGTKINVPMPPGCGDGDYRFAFEQVVMPAVRRFRPQFIMVSAGFDAHANDGLASMQVSVAGYAWMANAICLLARECCGGKLVLTLEGGYNLKALSYSVLAVIKVMLGEQDVEDPFPPTGHSSRNPHAESTIRHVAALHGLSECSN